jgi:hypothetical protein
MCGHVELRRAAFSTPGKCLCGSETWDGLGWVALDTVQPPSVQGENQLVQVDAPRVVREG